MVPNLSLLMPFLINLSNVYMHTIRQVLTYIVACKQGRYYYRIQLSNFLAKNFL